MVRKVMERPSRIAVPLLILIVLWGFVAGPRIRWIFAAVLIVGTAAAFLTNGRYALRRIMGVVPIMLVVSFLVFGLMASLPGDPAINILGPSATPDAVEQVRTELGLDQPFFNRYGDWLGDLVMGDLGTSVQRRQPVAEGIGQSITPSLQLMAYSVILASLLAFPLGVYAAYKQGKRPDRVINTVMLGFFAVPNFVIAVNLVLFFAIGGLSVFGTRLGLKILPGAGYVEFGEDPVEHFKRMLLPALSLALGQSAVFMRLLRSDMIGTLRLPFIDLARSKGLSTNRILWRHALRPSMFTLLTVMGFSVGALIGGAIITEVIFTLPGIGSFMLESITRRDYISVQGGTLVIATLYILTLVMVDFLYLALDPRLRTTGGGLGGGNG
ncbi:MAG: ABC transporter permease [Acidimicrobiia bacterium]|nr:ABC transporter permease [Acidimicrobiia bacterium]